MHRKGDIRKSAGVGASENAGSRIVTERARRGHAVTAIARNPERITPEPNVTPKRGDAGDRGALAQLLAGHDVAISSIHFLASDPIKLIGAAKDSQVGRYLVVGGAGSLELAPAVRLVTAPNFPAPSKAEAEKGAGFLDLLRQEKELNWTFLSPSALFTAGVRTGQFPLGADPLFSRAGGKKWISLEDFALPRAGHKERPRPIPPRVFLRSSNH